MNKILGWANRTGGVVTCYAHDSDKCIAGEYSIALYAREREAMLNELLGTFEVTERDKRLYDYATRYHTECEHYDRTVCTGPVCENSILPATYHELVLINRNERAVRKRIEKEATKEGYTQEELVRSISKWHGQVPNVERLLNEQSIFRRLESQGFWP